MSNTILNKELIYILENNPESLVGLHFYHISENIIYKVIAYDPIHKYHTIEWVEDSGVSHDFPEDHKRMLFFFLNPRYVFYFPVDSFSIDDLISESDGMFDGLFDSGFSGKYDSIEFLLKNNYFHIDFKPENFKEVLYYVYEELGMSFMSNLSLKRAYEAYRVYTPYVLACIDKSDIGEHIVYDGGMINHNKSFDDTHQIYLRDNKGSDYLLVRMNWETKDITVYHNQNVII
jgi:hypothetical protein